MPRFVVGGDERPEVGVKVVQEDDDVSIYLTVNGEEDCIGYFDGDKGHLVLYKVRIEYAVAGHLILDEERCIKVVRK